MSDGIYRYIIKQANASDVSRLLHPAGKVIRLYQHWPTAEVAWWRASVPLTRGGENREVLVQSLEYDLEISRDDFINWIGEFHRSGMTLVQSAEPLPYNVNPRRFRDSLDFERVLKKCGAMLLFELPHPNETCGVTLFSAQHTDWALQQKCLLNPDTDIEDESI